MKTIKQHSDDVKKHLNLNEILSKTKLEESIYNRKESESKTRSKSIYKFK